MANYMYISASTNVKPMAGKLRGIYVSNAAATPRITVYDSSSNTTTKTIIGVITPTASTSYLFPADGIYANDGIYVVISGTVTATIVYD